MSMLDFPYIKGVLHELEGLGYKGDQAKEVLLRHYKIVKRSMGFEPNPFDFALEIDDLEKAVKRQRDPNDPNYIYIGHLKEKLRKTKRIKSKIFNKNMKTKFNPYVAFDTSVYFSDGVVEILIYNFECFNIAETVSKLLNDAYHGGYQDGLYASLKEEYKDLVEKITSLDIENLKLKSQLRQLEDR